MAKLRPASIRHLHVFCIAAHHLSFKRAAQQLHLTPSAVSHRIRELEASVGVSLFERRTRAIELTEAGRALYAEIAPLLDEVEQSLTHIAQRLQRQRLRVTVPQFFASESLVPRLPGFNKRWPQVDLRLDSTNPRPSAHPADADASILIAAQRPAGVVSIALFELQLAVMCSPGYRSALGPLGPSIPSDVRLLCHRSWPDAWARWAASSGTALPRGASTIEFDTTFALLRAAEMGIGLALVPTYLGRDWLQTGDLIRLGCADLPTGEWYWFAARESDLTRNEVRAFRDWTLVEFAGH